MAKKETKPAKEEPQPAKTITLTIKDRFLIGEFFPERSSLVNQMIVQDLTEKTEIGKKEREEIGLKPVPGGQAVVWDEKRQKDIEVPLSGVEIDFLKSQVDRIEKLAATGQGGFTIDTAKIARKIKAL